jgi:uncharacterized protein (TIGR02996 family)
MTTIAPDYITRDVLTAWDNFTLVDALQDAGCFDPNVIAGELHRMIVQEPEDDSLRLLWADWIERAGQKERAEFVRVQCQIAKGMATPGRNGELRRREMELWRPQDTNLRLGLQVPEDFDYGIGISPNERGPHALISRGFISSLTCTWADFLRIEKALIWWPKRKCERCEGNGTTICLNCHGKMRLAGWHEDEADYPCGCDRGLVQCSACHGKGEVPGAGDECPNQTPFSLYFHRPVHDSNCLCSGTGRIPRPFPLTAMPITDVHLTTWPAPEGTIGEDGGRHWNEVGETELRRRWPSIKSWTLLQV